MQKMAVFLFGHGNTLQHKDESAPCRTDIDWLIGGIQDEDGRQQRMAVPRPMRPRRDKHAGAVPRSWFVFHP